MASTSSSSKPRGKKRDPRSKAARRAAARRELLRDLVGALLVIVGVLAGLGAYVDAAGPLGGWLDALVRGLLGVFGLLAPPLLVVGGLAVLAQRRPPGRLTAGVAVALLGVLGLWHLARGAPRLDAPTEALHAASGWVGALLVGPVVTVAAVAGAAVLFVVAVVVGILLAVGRSPRPLAAWVLDRSQAGLANLRARRAARRAARAEASADAKAAGADAGAETAEGGAESAGAGDSADGPVVEGLVDDSDHEAAGAAEGDAPEASHQATPEDREQPGDTATLPVGLAAGGSELGTADEDYELPPLELLATGTIAAGNKRSLDQMTRALEHTLRQFNVDARVARVRRGPTVTRFEIELGEGVRVGAVTKLGDDLAYALATPEIRIVSPIPGKSAIGIEVPNRERDLITLGDVLRGDAARAETHPLAVAVGIDIGGNHLMANLTRMPHLLIAGATGSGKSVLMNAIVTSVLMRATPAQARMVLIDPKRVELNHYEGAPHLITPVITDPKRATEALEWVVEEMEQRYERLSELGFRNLDAYNAAVRKGTVPTPPAGGRLAAEMAALEARDADTSWPELPYIMVVIDELADLMMIAPRDVENAVVRIAQMARAVGIHLIVATQRPSVDVVTGLIKANIPSRIALSMATGHDSKTILDQYGAEKLVGDGDLLFQPANASKPHRLQGAFVGEEELERVVGHCTAQRQPEYRSGVIKQGEDARWADVTSEDASDADLTTAAMELVVRSGLGSTSMLQRKLKVGFARAGRLMDELEQLGVVGASEGPKARQVLMTVEELEQRLGGGRASGGGSGGGDAGGGGAGGDHQDRDAHAAGAPPTGGSDP